jgi:hypothetical protein
MNSAVPWKCRVILTTEERLFCVDPASWTSGTVAVIPWANVRSVQGQAPHFFD